MWSIISSNKLACRRITKIAQCYHRRHFEKQAQHGLVGDNGTNYDRRLVIQTKSPNRKEKRKLSTIPQKHNPKRDAPTWSESIFEQTLAELPDGAQIHLDFFGEPVTFLGGATTKTISNAVAALDGFEIGVVSKGKAFTGGGEEEGLGIQAAHSAALSWSELLRHASIWSKPESSAPMLAYVAVAPMLAQTGVGYIKYVDSLLEQAESGVEGLPPIQLLSLAKSAAAMKDHEHLNPREKSHLRALDCMLRHDHKRAMMILLKHLQTCPGDALALSIILDICHTVGDKDAALR
jgi:hypothetical protein